MRNLMALLAPVFALLQVDAAYGHDVRPCPVTAQPSGGMLRNDALAVPIMPHGTITFGAGHAGFVLPDGALMIKYGWIRLRDGQFSIHGRRLDGSAPPLRARITEKAAGDRFEPVSLIFPTAGCWEVTGQLDDTKLSFVVHVIALKGIPSAARRSDKVPVVPVADSRHELNPLRGELAADLTTDYQCCAYGSRRARCSACAALLSAQ